MSVLITRPIFDGQFRRQLELIPAERNVNLMVRNLGMKLEDAGRMLKSIAALGHNAHIPHVVTLPERSDQVKWIIIPSIEGWVAVSEEGTLKWSDPYDTRLMKYFREHDYKEVMYLTVAAVACGVSLERLMDNIMRCDAAPRWMYTDIIEAMTTATEVMGGGRLKVEFNYSR